MAIAAGALIGPAQVAARVLEFGLLRRFHPLASARLAASAHPLTGALLDRLTHHVNILEMNGESYRLAQSRARKSGDNT